MLNHKGTENHRLLRGRHKGAQRIERMLRVPSLLCYFYKYFAPPELWGWMMAFCFYKYIAPPELFESL